MIIAVQNAAYIYIYIKKKTPTNTKEHGDLLPIAFSTTCSLGTTHPPVLSLSFDEQVPEPLTARENLMTVCVCHSTPIVLTVLDPDEPYIIFALITVDPPTS